MKNKCTIILDSGTTFCRSLVVNEKGEIITLSQAEFTKYFPKSGWVDLKYSTSTMQTVKT